MKTIPNYTPFQYQKDTISNLLEIVDINNGACIYDETGLGKTITSLTTAINLGNSILVISPVANKNAWVKVANHISDVNIDISTIQSLSKLPDNKYDVVIVDEAHNFRNVKNKSYIELFLTIQKNKAKTLLLTATPFNNNFIELKAMLSLILFKNNTLPFYNLPTLLSNIIDTEKKYIISKDKPNNYGVEIKLYTELNTYLSDLKDVLATFTVRNTRDYISANYPSDISLMGNFPIIDFENISVEVEIQGKILETIDIIEKTPLSRQNIIKYLTSNIEDTNSDFTGLYRTLLLKRLDSSVYAFKQTIAKSLHELEVLNKEKVYRINNEVVEVKDYFWQDVETDISNFTKLVEMWENSGDTTKTNILVDIISEIVTKKEKVVIFTEYNDTLDVIQKALSNFRVIRYNSLSTEKELEKIVYDFDANIDISDMKNNFDVLICTDVLSEGVNLHRAKYVVDYDSKWNPSKLKQRHGRVDRIDINNNADKTVHIKRFGTDSLVEKIIKLEAKIKRKTEYFDILTDISYIPNTYRLDRFESGKILGYRTNSQCNHRAAICIRNEKYDFCLSSDFLRNYIKEDMSRYKYVGYVKSDSGKLGRFDYIKRNQISSAFKQDSLSVYFHNSLYFDIYYSIMKRDKNKIDVDKLKMIVDITSNIDVIEIDYTMLYISRDGTLYVGDEIL